MKKEMTICDTCGEVIKEGYTLFGSLYHLNVNASEHIAGKLLSEENHFCKLCFAKMCNLNWVTQR